MENMLTTATREDILNAYQLVLGRRADERGLRYFVELAKSQGLTAHEVAKLLFSSEEFRAGNGGTHEPTEIPLDGYSMFVRTSDRDIGSAIGRGVSYEPHVTALLRRELSRGDVVLDVGANIGYFTMLGAHLVGESGHVLAIEPMDKNLQLIYLAIEKNRYRNVEVFPFGASDHIGLVPIVTDPNTSNALVRSTASKTPPSIYAPVRTLDWMCQGIDRLDFVKMDIEGHEVFAWRGAKNLFAKFKPKIATEFHPFAMKENSGIDYREYLAIMWEYSPVIEVIVSPEQLVACSTTREVMEQWEKSDKRHGGTGTSHLDLFLRPCS